MAADDLRVVDHVSLPGGAWMLDLHPDGQKVIVGVDAGFHIYAVQADRLVQVAAATAPSTVFSFEVSPRGDRILAVTVRAEETIADAQLHLFRLVGERITHLHRIEATSGTGPIERGFSPRISPDGNTALVLHDFGIGGKGTLDDVLIVDLSLERPVVTQLCFALGMRRLHWPFLHDSWSEPSRRAGEQVSRGREGAVAKHASTVSSRPLTSRASTLTRCPNQFSPPRAQSTTGAQSPRTAVRTCPNTLLNVRSAA